MLEWKSWGFEQPLKNGFGGESDNECAETTSSLLSWEQWPGESKNRTKAHIMSLILQNPTFCQMMSSALFLSAQGCTNHIWIDLQLEARLTDFFTCSQILVNIFISTVHIYWCQVVQVMWRNAESMLWTVLSSIVIKILNHLSLILTCVPLGSCWFAFCLVRNNKRRSKTFFLLLWSIIFIPLKKIMVKWHQKLMHLTVGIYHGD